MGALTDHAVDPAIAGNSGGGTIGNEYGDLQHAFDTVTRDASNGNRFNIKAGTSELLAATLSIASYGTGTFQAPLMLQGYTSEFGDGGIGVIDGQGLHAILDVAGVVHLKDLHLTNVGANTIAKLQAWSIVDNVTFSLSSGTANAGLWLAATHCRATRCRFVDIEGYGLNSSASNAGAIIDGNTFENGATYSFNRAISAAGYSSCISNNRFSLGGATIGIYNTHKNVIVGNRIWSNAGTVNAIQYASEQGMVHGNIIVGFSGVGGQGIGSSNDLNANGNNAFFDNTSNDDGSAAMFSFGPNVTLTGDPFTDAANGDLSITSAQAAVVGLPTSFLTPAEAAGGGGGSGPVYPGIQPLETGL